MLAPIHLYSCTTTTTTATCMIARILIGICVILRTKTTIILLFIIAIDCTNFSSFLADSSKHISHSHSLCWEETILIVDCSTCHTFLRWCSWNKTVVSKCRILLAKLALFLLFLGLHMQRQLLLALMSTTGDSSRINITIRSININIPLDIINCYWQEPSLLLVSPSITVSSWAWQNAIVVVMFVLLCCDDVINICIIIRLVVNIRLFRWDRWELLHSTMA